MGNNHFIYIIECKDQTLYTGYTNDIPLRFQKHQEGKGAKYTRGRGPLRLVYTEEFKDKKEAMQREYAIKRLPRKEKLALIAALQTRKE